MDKPLYIFCGGNSRRMGQDKALLDLNGESLLNRQIKRGREYFNDVCLLTGKNRYETDCRQIPDFMDDAGPLSGLLSALRHAKQGYQQIAVIPVDVPFLSDNTLKTLSEKILFPDTDALVLSSDDRIQPFAGIYSVTVTEKLQAYLEEGQRMVMKFIEQLYIEKIPVKSYELKNLNYPDDIQNI